MIRWCIYCQRFLGEVEPRDDYSMTHGICDSCAKISGKGPLKADELQSATAPLRDLQKRIYAAGRAGRLDMAPLLIEEAILLGVRPIDFLLGFIQPLLYRTGTLWKAGAITVADEHVFTAFADELVRLVRSRYFTETRKKLEEHPRVLLVNVDGNSHTLGPSIAELLFLDAGIPVMAVLPGLPADNIAELVLETKPEVLGISVAMPEQFSKLHSIDEALECNSVRASLRVVVGGYAIKMEDRPLLPPLLPNGFEAAKDAQAFLLSMRA